jgi:ribonuclease E
MLDNEPTGSADDTAPVEGGGPTGGQPADATETGTAPTSAAETGATRRTRGRRRPVTGDGEAAEGAAEAPGQEPDQQSGRVAKATSRRRSKAAIPDSTAESAESARAGRAAPEVAEPLSADETAGDVPAAPVSRTRGRRRKAVAAEVAAGDVAPEDAVAGAAAPEDMPTGVAASGPVASGPVASGVVPAGEMSAAVAEEHVIREAPVRHRRATTAVVFMAPEASDDAAPRTPAARSAAAEAEAADEPVAGETVPGETVPGETVAGETVRKRRRGRRAAAEVEAAEAAEFPGPVTPEATAADEEDQEADADEDDESAAARRRRRRGRRGRGRGKGTHDEYDDEEEPAAGGRGSGVAAAEAGEPDEGEEDEADGEPLTRRRRRRRRKGGADVGGAETEDGVPTVVRIREPRKVADEVQGVSGSTRLEAKRQRRRDGREQRRTRPPILSESEFLARREAVDRMMVVRQKADRMQIAVLEDGVLVEHYVSRASAGTMAGNVYLGKVQNVLPSMEAAFVDVGRGRNAVLYAGEVNWDTTGLEGRARSIEQALKAGDSVLVQVTKDPVGHKGARLTSHIALSGRHLVYVPNGNASGISRKLPDTERRRLRDILKKLVPDGAGVIVRTAAEGASEEELARDVKRLQAQWEDIQAKASTGGAPVLLYEEPDLVIRVVRDLFNEDFRELVVQGTGAYDMVEAYLGHVSPDLVERLRRHTGAGDAFAEMRIDEQILKGLDRKVFLPSGGHLVIDRTEAMTVIDVNTGKYTGAGGNLEETVTRNNLEAAEEIVRQLRLRDLGGIVVIDFIDMVLESNRDLVLRRLTECLGRDRTKHQVTEITSLGLVQMTRKRIGAGLLEAFSETCECCKGRGLIIHTEPVAEKGRGGAGGNGNVAERVKAVASASAGAGAGQKGEADGGRRRGRKSAAAVDTAAVRTADLVDVPAAESEVVSTAVLPSGGVARDVEGTEELGPDAEETRELGPAAGTGNGAEARNGRVGSVAEDDDEDDLEASASGGRRRVRRGGSRRRRS